MGSKGKFRFRFRAVEALSHCQGCGASRVSFGLLWFPLVSVGFLWVPSNMGQVSTARCLEQLGLPPSSMVQATVFSSHRQQASLRARSKNVLKQKQPQQMCAQAKASCCAGLTSNQQHRVKEKPPKVQPLFACSANWVRLGAMSGRNLTARRAPGVASWDGKGIEAKGPKP